MRASCEDVLKLRSTAKPVLAVVADKTAPVAFASIVAARAAPPKGVKLPMERST